MTRIAAKHARTRMEAAREDAARNLLDWDQVVKAIGEAAGKGFGVVVFAPPAGVAIKGTEAASAVVQRLTAAGFRTEWRDRRDPHDVSNHELAIGWDSAAISNG